MTSLSAEIFLCLLLHNLTTGKRRHYVRAAHAIKSGSWPSFLLVNSGVQGGTETNQWMLEWAVRL